jgi:hypothetical protein
MGEENMFFCFLLSTEVELLGKEVTKPMTPLATMIKEESSYLHFLMLMLSYEKINYFLLGYGIKKKIKNTKNIAGIYSYKTRLELKKMNSQPDSFNDMPMK